jgi:prefoldin beta subunit
MNNEQQNMIMDYQELQSKLQNIMMEKQQLLMQSNEIDRALKALNDVTGKTYEMIGTVLIERDKDNINSDLLERKQMLDLRTESLEKNERTIKSRLQSLTEKLTNMNKGQGEN